MYQTVEPFQAVAQTRAPTAVPIVTGAQLLDVARRQWPLILGCTLAITAAVLIYVLLASPRFTAATRILMDTRQAQVLDKQTTVAGNAMIDTGMVDSQVEILTSDNLLATVVRNLNLVNDPDFQPRRSILSTLTSYLSFSSEGPPSEERRIQSVVTAMQDNLRVTRSGVSYVLTVSYTGLSAAKAAQIANAIADAYIVGGLEAKYDSTKRAGQWLQARSVELREEATRADRIVQTFKSSNGIVGTSRGLMSEQELTDVNTQLVQARAATQEAKARLDRIKLMTDSDVVQATVSDALNNSVIVRLRAQYLDLASQYADWSGRYGTGHQASVNLFNRMTELRRSIADEMRRIASAYQSDYDIARAKEHSLQTDLDSLVKQAGTSGQTQVELRNLESTADTSRTLYNNFLERLQQATQQESFPISDARIITTAMPPPFKSAPKTLVLLIAGTVAGALLGSAAAFAREIMNDVFRTHADVEEHLGLKCLGILPTMKAAHFIGGQRRSRKAASFVIDNAFSRYAETLRNVKVSIDVARMSKEMKVIGIVSSLPKEGKTTITANLGHLAAMSGHRTLVIDCDLHTCSLTQALAPEAKRGLIEALADPSQFAALAQKIEVSGVDVLPAVVPSRMVNSADILASSAMGRLLVEARDKYDYIFLDLAPIMPVTDAKAASHLLDGIVYVVEWGKTRRAAVEESIAGTEELHGKLVGAVLNLADPKALRRIEGYKGSYYNSYYVEQA